MKKQNASPRRRRAAADNLCSDHIQLLCGAGLAALAAGMALGAASPAAAGETITGPAGGPIAWTSGDLTIDPAGTIGAAARGVAASGSSLGTFTNYGQILVTETGVDIAPSSTVSSLGNFGLIQSGGVGVAMGSGAQVSALSNLSGGTIHGVQAGVAISGATGWISNAGLIQSDTGFGVANGGELGILQNQAGGTILSNGSGDAAAVYVSGGVNTFSNSGSILAPNAFAVIITGGAVTHLSNEAGGDIESANAAIWNNGAIGVLSNGGRITSAADAAVRNFVSIDSLANWGAIGGPTAIANSGAIGALSNSGTIQAGNVAIDSSGSIRTLTNAAGGLIAANIGVRVDGSIGALDNSGYITATTRAILIDSGGALGSLSNRGVIEGAIENQSANDLTISGGSPSAPGVLTGMNGGQGAIYNAASDLRMSGALLLDDALFLGARALFSSADLSLSRSVGLSGNFNQDGGSLTFAVASPTNYAQLNVSGPAKVRIANAAFGLKPASSGILAQGQNYTVVQAATGAIAIANDTAQVAGFTGVLTNTGHAVVLSLLAPAPSGPAGSAGPGPAGPSSGGAGSPGSTTPASGGSAAPGAGDSGAGGSGPSGSGSGSGGSGSGFPPAVPSGGGGSSGAGGALDVLADGSTPQAQAFNSVIAPLLVGLSPSQQTRALTQLGPSTLGVEMGLQVASPVAGAVAAQQAGYVARLQGRSYASLGDDLYGGGVESPPRGLWGKVLGAGAGGDASGGAPFSAAMVGAVVGGDVVRAEQVYAGLAASWTGAWATGKGPASGQRLHFDSYQLTAYGSFAPRAFRGRLTLDAMLGAGLNRYQQERGIDFLHSAARADYDGEQYTARLTAGYAFVGRRLTLTPYIGVDETHAVQHGYTESGAGLADLHVGGLAADTFRHDIGFKLDGDYDVGAGVRMIPSLKLGWGHTYDNGPIAVYSTLAGVSFSSLAARPAADGALVGAALAFRSRGRISVGFEYEGDLRRDFQAHTGAVRVRVRF